MTRSLAVPASASASASPPCSVAFPTREDLIAATFKEKMRGYADAIDATHSNWIETFLTQNEAPPLADTLFPACTPSALPQGLQTGYYAFEPTNSGGCPASGPPPPYQFCHETLNKDNNSSIQGRKTTAPDGSTYHQLAIQLARAHTSKLYQIVTASLARDWTNDFPKADADCLIAHVFQDTKDPCLLNRPPS